MKPFWNWKTALNSGLYRAVPFALTVWASSGKGVAEAAAMQFVFFGTIAGFVGTVTERLRFFRPRWLAALILLAGAAATVHLLEWRWHEAAAPAARRAGFVVSWIQSALSIATQWTLMREGLFLSGARARSYLDDWRSLPLAVRRLLARAAGR